jgi:hypothetical protein
MQFGIDRKEKLFEMRFVRCGNDFVIKVSVDLMPTAYGNIDAAFEVGQFPLDVRSR